MALEDHHNNKGGTNSSHSQVESVTQALEIARDSSEGAQDPTVKQILETALTEIWSRIQAQPSSYVMSREEFAVFNLFQKRFEGQELAIAARKRYWDSQWFWKGKERSINIYIYINLDRNLPANSFELSIFIS